MRRATPAPLPRLRDRLPLGKTGLTVSPICLGMVREASTIEAAFDAGCNFFFVSADLHWPGYKATRTGLQALAARGPSTRDAMVVAVVSYVARTGFVHAAMHELLAAVPALGRVDMLVVGGADEHDLLPRLHGAARIQAAGEARSLAATLHGRRAGLTACNHRLVDVAFVRYNPAHPGARRDLFPAVDPGSPTLLYNFKSTFGAPGDASWQALALSEDYWRPAVTDFYRFALSQPRFDGLLCAPGTPAELEALAAALEQPPLSEEEQQYLIDLADLMTGRATLKSVPG
jgi:aryl-alcohol dehydrogenase-like predicted oxidoreductase